MKNRLPLFITVALLILLSEYSLAQEKSQEYYINAKEYIKKDSLGLALIELDSAIKLSPKSSVLYTLKGGIFELKKEDRKAIGQYSLAILYNPNEASTYLKRATLYYHLKDHRNYILNDVNEAIRIEPSNSDLFELKAFYYAHTLNQKSLKRDYENAILALNKAIALNPTNSRYYNNRSDYKLKNKQNLSSLLDINKAIKLDDNIDSYYHQRAVVRFVMEDFRSSLNDINRAIDINDNSISYFQFRGNVYYNLKRYEQAYQDYSTCINLIFKDLVKSKSEIKPSNPLNLKLRQTLLLRGMSLVHGNKPFDGCDDFNKALQMGESKAINYIKQFCN